MKRRLGILAISVLVFLDRPGVAWAGMPSLTLTDLARMRLQTISFFLVVFLLCSWLVRRIWNAARSDFPWLPLLTFRRAAGLVALWGFLFLLILTMISGARELMTPGAWTKEGFTYKLKAEEEGRKEATIEREAERRAALDKLRTALWTYARHHEGRFPPSESSPEIPVDVWRVPDPSGMRYLYVAGLVANRDHSPLAFEPGTFGVVRLVLLTDGKIVFMNEGELSSAAGKAP